jgi:hypothetical protein
MAIAANVMNTTSSGTIHLLSHLHILALWLLVVIRIASRELALVRLFKYLIGNIRNHKVPRP